MVAGGIVFTGIYLSMADLNIFSSPYFLFFTAFFSLLPDIDHTSSILGKPFYPISRYLDLKFGHRTITHSLVCYVALIAVVKLIETIATGENVITHIFIWAYASHLILDMLTIKGIPLFYPFKKNPCVIPGNPKYRFHAANYKTEGMMFGFFILLTFSLQDLFANGFWNTYNRTWDSVKALYTEKLLTDKMIKVDYEFSINNVAHKGKGILIDATLSEAIIFDKQFFKVQKSDRIIHLTPIRTDRNLILKQETFTDVSFDSLQHIIENKPIISLKLQSTLPIQFNKDNKPQSSNSVDLDYIYNPVLQSQNIDSLDLTIAKEIELTKQELFNNEAQLKIYHMQQSQYEEQKKEAFAKYAEVRENINSSDLATRERAIKDLPAAKSKYESFNQIKSIPVNQISAINIKLNFLKSKLYVKKSQSINGFISYFIIH